MALTVLVIYIGILCLLCAGCIFYKRYADGKLHTGRPSEPVYVVWKTVNPATGARRRSSVWLSINSNSGGRRKSLIELFNRKGNVADVKNAGAETAVEFQEVDMSSRNTGT
ncbi:hypothetical protein BJ878DRAFT_478573 [Calycina marina]|uniref:Uncharacterized protein n=1 Tax=Calycina marina TaxID=1763456 RepID=A0A9P7Z6I7_9HELO|nr:hypothetical protein BJ878DRAFT_478573 [Calycina marina]